MLLLKESGQRTVTCQKYCAYDADEHMNMYSTCVLCGYEKEHFLYIYNLIQFEQLINTVQVQYLIAFTITAGIDTHYAIADAIATRIQSEHQLHIYVAISYISVFVMQFNDVSGTECEDICEIDYLRSCK